MGRRTKELAPTLSPGAIVVLDHPDLDSVAARSLVSRRPAAILNNRAFVTGRYPNRGPALLLAAGIPIFERTDESDDLFARLSDGETVTLEGNALKQNSADPAKAAPLPLAPLTDDLLNQRLAAARENLDAEISRFARNTLHYLDREDERALLLDPTAVPETIVKMTARPALVVVRGEHYEEDIDSLSTYIREQKPVLIAVDGAADALLTRGLKPDILLGDMDSVTDEALRCGAELIVHAYVRPKSDGEIAPGLKRLESLGLAARTFPVAGTSEDAALLLAYEKGADLIVAVGTHSNLEDFLDKGRGGMASTFLVRLKVGSRLVDARGVSRLYTSRGPLGRHLVLLFLAALFPILVLLGSTPVGQLAWRSIVIWFRLRF